MAVIQSSQPELRYLKRQNLEHEAKIVGNLYLDQIHSYGIDIVYHKLNLKNFTEYKTILDNNNLIRQAYGYEIDPDYSISAHMITYMSIENDIFQLNKYGIIPNMDVEFSFDINDFATKFANQLGQYREININLPISCNLPDDLTTETKVNIPILQELNNEVSTINLNGNVEFNVISVETGDTSESNISCSNMNLSGVYARFPVNKYLAKSFMYEINSLNSLDYILSGDFNVVQISSVISGDLSNDISNDISNDLSTQNVLVGNITGTVLFYDLTRTYKYMEKIHPDVGDVITIDFPNGSSAEQYEITEAIDKQMTNDGINSFLHKYIWKCKARKYINSHEEMDKNEANERVDEAIKYDNAVKEDVDKKISLYPEGEDATYGKYDGLSAIECYDKETQPKVGDVNQVVLMEFACGSKLITDGYELYFIDNQDNVHLITVSKVPYIDPTADNAGSGLRYLKATDDMLAFCNVEGESWKIVENQEATQDALELCLNDLFANTLDPHDVTSQNTLFYTFKETRTVLWATGSNLYCRLACDKKLYLII